MPAIRESTLSPWQTSGADQPIAAVQVSLSNVCFAAPAVRPSHGRRRCPRPVVQRPRSVDMPTVFSRAHGRHVKLTSGMEAGSWRLSCARDDRRCGDDGPDPYCELALALGPAIGAAAMPTSLKPLALNHDRPLLAEPVRKLALNTPADELGSSDRRVWASKWLRRDKATSENRLVSSFHTALYGHRPVCQADLDVILKRGTGCSLISGLWCKPKPAGPDGIRQERPHLGRARVVQGCVQVCVPAVRPVSPSHVNQPQQPIGTAIRLPVC